MTVVRPPAMAPVTAALPLGGGGADVDWKRAFGLRCRACLGAWRRALVERSAVLEEIIVAGGRFGS